MNKKLIEQNIKVIYVYDGGKVRLITKSYAKKYLFYTYIYLFKYI